MADRLNDDQGGGLCADDPGTVTGYQLEQTCEGLSGEYQDCWMACIEAAGTCDEADLCQDDCRSC